jgi:HicB_like antitoxin of bacterial toxin-antitoxin system
MALLPRALEISRYTQEHMKVLVSIEDRLLRRIDRAARERGMSRSAYLAELAARDLGMARGSGATRRARGALRRADRLFARLPHEDAVAAIRAERDARG